MIWLIIVGVMALLFGMYKTGPGSKRNEVNKKTQNQDQLRKAMEKYKHKKR